MASNAETVAGLVLRYPQFSPIDSARLQAFAQDARVYVPAGLTGDRADQALMYKTGSLLLDSLTLTVDSAGAAAGQVKRMKEGEVEIEYFGGEKGVKDLQNLLEGRFNDLLTSAAQVNISPQLTGFRWKR